jgi:hypothetical protein
MNGLLYDDACTRETCISPNHPYRDGCESQKLFWGLRNGCPLSF